MIYYYERIIFQNLRKEHSENGPKENERTKSRPGNTGNKIKTYSPLSYLTAAGRTECYQQAILRFFFGSEAYRVTGTPPDYVLFYGIESLLKRKVRTTTVEAKRSPSYWDKEL